MITFKEWCKKIEQGPEGIASLFTIYGAKSYVPLRGKLNMIDLAVHEQRYENKETKEITVVPPACIVKDDKGYATVGTMQKYLFLMQVYLAAYFDVDFENEDFTDTDYDLIMSRNYQARINRIVDRRDLIDRKEYDYISVRRQIVEQQNDFRIFEKMLNKELTDECNRLNEPYVRLSSMPQMMIEALLDRIEMDTTPEKVQQATQEMKNLVAEIEQRNLEVKE